MDFNSFMHRVSTKRLIERCKDEFGWEKLSNDVIMDVGCGVRGYGVQRILQLFPAVGTIIGICNDQEEVDKFKETTKKIEFAVADIEKRETVQNYEGRITKAISTHVFHQIMEKEEAFRNIYHLLKPGGEVAVLFVIKSVTYEWLTEMLKNPKWKDACQSHYVEDLYKRELEASEYKNMAVNIGFQEVKCLEKRRKLAYPTDRDCKEALYEIYGKSFNISSELLHEFKEESFQVFLKLSKRNKYGKPCYRFREMYFLFIKPTDGFASETS